MCEGPVSALGWNRAKVVDSSFQVDLPRVNFPTSTPHTMGRES